MTGVEVAMAMAIVGGGGFGFNKKQQATKEREMKEVGELYELLFKENLQSKVTHLEPTKIASSFTSVIGPAKDAIVIIENYQTIKWGASWWTSPEMDARMIVLEEFKQWLQTISEEPPDCDTIGLRVDYCHRLLMYPDLFVGSNKLTFNNTCAQLCILLNKMMAEAIKERKTTAGQIGRINELGHASLIGHLPVLFFVAVDTSVFTPEVPTDASALALWSGPGSRDNEFLQLLHAFRSTIHFNQFMKLDLEAPADDFREVLSKIRANWDKETVSRQSGLTANWQGPDRRESRLQLLSMFELLDKVAFFCLKLEPLYSIANKVGDMATCKLHEMLSFLLKELEAAVLQLQQVRNDVMSVAKTELQRLAKNFASAWGADRTWMASLRNIDEQALDQNSQHFTDAFIELRAASNSARAFELQALAHTQLSALADEISSPEFQSRMSRQNRGALENIAQNARHLAAGQVPALTTGPAPAIEA